MPATKTDTDKPDAAKAADKPETKELPDVQKGLALLEHDDPNATATHEGVEIVRGKDGFYLAPLAFAEHLEPHGFRVVKEGK